MYIRISPLFWNVFLPHTPAKYNCKDVRQLGHSCLMTSVSSPATSSQKYKGSVPLGRKYLYSIYQSSLVIIKSSDPVSLGLAFGL